MATYDKTISLFKDPTDGITRSFRFEGNIDDRHEYVVFKVTCVSIETHQQFTTGLHAPEYSFLSVIKANPVTEDAANAAQGYQNPWEPNVDVDDPIKTLAGNISSVMSSGGLVQKYSMKFLDNFTDEPDQFRFFTIGSSSHLGQLNVRGYKSCTFRFPLTRKFNSNMGRLRWGTNEKPMGSMEVYLQSNVISAQLDVSFEAIKNLSSAAANSYGDPDNSDGWILYVPWFYIEITDKEKYNEWVTAQRQLALREASSGIGLTDEQRAQSLPLNEQAILLYRMGELLEYNRDKKRKEKQYDRFATLEVDGSKQIESLVNQLTSPPNAAALFDKIKPMHLSAVVPRVRLWKEYHWKDNRINNGGASSEDPVFIEYEFEEHVDPGLLGQTLTTNTGVGLESFNWEFNGDNQVSAEKLIQAQIKLNAQSIDALEKTRYSSNTSVSGKNRYAFSDIFTPDKRRKDNNGNRTATGDYHEYVIQNMRVRAEVEYALDMNDYMFSAPENKPIAQALNKSKLTLNLSVVTYEIDLRDDGSVGVTINFQGSIDTTDRDPTVGNILPNREFTEDQASLLIDERADAQTRADMLKKHLDDMHVRRQEALAPLRQHSLTDEQKEQELESYTANVKETKKELQELTTQYQLSLQDNDRGTATEQYLDAVGKERFNRLSLYRTILNGLLNRDSVHILSIDPRNVAKTHQDIQKGANKGRLILNEEMSVGLQNWTAENPDPNTLTKEQMDDHFKYLQERMKQDIFPMFMGTQYFIRFFYFGDLIDIVLDNMYSGKGRGKGLDIRTILGPIQIMRNVFSANDLEGGIKFLSTGDIVVADKYGTYNPSETRELESAVNQADTYMERASRAQNNGTPPPPAPPPVQELLASLADVPISLNLFLKWFSESISNIGAAGYPFKKFLTHAINKLIVASLQADSSRVLLPKQKRIIKTVLWDGATTSAPDAFGFIKTAENGLEIALTKEERISRSRTGSELSQVRKDVWNSYKFGGGAPMSDYLLVYAESVDAGRKYSGSNADYQRDISEGVYHLSLGRDCGVVKDISLAADPTPGYKEMMLQRSMKSNEEVRIKRVYAATITMYGVTFFRPGQTIYIDPAAYGKREDLKAHGLCGYYTIITTANNFAAGKFETTLQCSFSTEG